MSVTRLCLVLITVTVGSTLGQKIQLPPPWGFQTYIGSDIKVECNSTEAMVDSTDILVWYSPTGMRIKTDVKYTLEDSVTVKSMYLKVNNVTDADKGVYLCMVYRNTVFRTKVNRGINIYEPLYRNNFDRYRNMVLIGGVAAAVLFVPLVCICFVYKFRFKTDEERQKIKEAEMIRKGHFFYSADAEAGQLPKKYALNEGVGLDNEGYENTKL